MNVMTVVRNSTMTTVTNYQVPTTNNIFVTKYCNAGASLLRLAVFTLVQEAWGCAGGGYPAAGHNRFSSA